MSFDLGATGSVLVLVWLVVAASARISSARSWRGAALVAGLVAAFLRVDGLALFGYVRGHLGDLSVPSQVLLGLGIARRLGGPPIPGPRDRRALLLGILAASAFLYPLALGLGPFDPYRLGYGSVALVAVAGLAAALAWLSRLPVTLASILGALLAWGLEMGESPNVWDYLVDAWIALFALAFAIACVYETRRALQIPVNAEGGLRRSKNA